MAQLLMTRCQYSFFYAIIRKSFHFKDKLPVIAEAADYGIKYGHRHKAALSQIVLLSHAFLNVCKNTVSVMGPIASNIYPFI